MANRTFPERAEITLMCLFGISLIMIVQVYSITLFQIGLGLLIVCTLLEIGVANLPAGASPRRSIAMVGMFLSIIAAVFALGIFLVPYLTNLGR